MSAPTRSDLARMLTAARSATRPRQVARASRVALIAFATAVMATALSAHEIHIFPHTSPARTFLGIGDEHVSSHTIGRDNKESNMRGIKSGAMAAALVTAVASGQNAVQWRVEDGGNGHWYAMTTDALSWPDARAACELIGGHIVTLVGEVEWAWMKSNISIGNGAWAGASQDPTLSSYSEPSGGWTWITGEPLSFGSHTIPFDDCPGVVPPGCICGSGAQDALVIMGCCNNRMNDEMDGTSNDCTNWGKPWDIRHTSVIEWEADCNSDGIVDYGQILAGELGDTNTNNIPDCCESIVSCDPCPADIDESGAVNAVDLAAILNSWGSDGGKYPRADIDGNGIVDASDLTVVLSSWGACP